jgi:hypothetical protein
MPLLPNLIVMSVPTSGNGATPAATFSFFTEGYKPARQARAVGWDDVNNHNGHFRYRYDNGPGAFAWEPFAIVCSDSPAIANYGATQSATQQLANVLFLWQYTSAIGLTAPDGTYSVGWGQADLERRFTIFPSAAGDKLEIRCPITLVED